MRAVAAVTLLLAATFIAGAPPAAADEVRLAISPSEGAVGDRVIVRFAGWNANAVTLHICGNLGLRGSPDCDLLRGKGVGLARTGPTLAELEISRPPVSCLCVVQASSVESGEVHRVPLVITGQPVGPVQAPATTDALLSASVRVSGVDDGWPGRVRRALGGRSRHRVAITLRNTSSVTLSKVTLGLTVGRSVEGAQAVSVPEVEPLDPGETRAYEVPATLAAPTWGRYVWGLTVDGAGPEVRTAARSKATPWLLVVLAVLLLADVGAIAALKALRRARRRSGGASACP